MKKSNGYIMMIAAMTAAQLIYDSSIFLFNNPAGDYLYAQVFLGISAGTATAFWSLTIGCVLTYVIVSRKYYDIEIHFPKMFFSILIASCLLGAVNMMYLMQGNLERFAEAFEAFNYVRITIILLNIIIIVYAWYYIQSIVTSKTRAKNPIHILARRLIMYPVVQIISRLPVTIYQLSFHESLESYAKDDDPSTIKTFWFFFSTITVPSAGIGNFLVFLIVQPEAKSIVKHFIRYLLSSYCCCIYGQEAFIDSEKEEMEKQKILGKKKEKYLRNSRRSSKRASSIIGFDKGKEIAGGVLQKDTEEEEKEISLHNKNLSDLPRNSLKYSPYNRDSRYDSWASSNSDKTGSSKSDFGQGGGFIKSTQSSMLDSYYETDEERYTSEESALEMSTAVKDVNRHCDTIPETSTFSNPDGTESNSNSTKGETFASSLDESEYGSPDDTIDYDVLDEEELVREIGRMALIEHHQRVSVSHPDEPSGNIIRESPVDLNYTNALNSGNIGPTSGREGVENQVMNALHKDS